MRTGAVIAMQIPELVEVVGGVVQDAAVTDDSSRDASVNVLGRNMKYQGLAVLPCPPRHHAPSLALLSPLPPSYPQTTRRRLWHTRGSTTSSLESNTAMPSPTSYVEFVVHRPCHGTDGRCLSRSVLHTRK